MEMKEVWRDYHEWWDLGPEKYEVGDIVSRDGTDEQEVLEIDYDSFSFGMLKTLCLKAPEEGWCKVGETEDNVIYRYSLVRKKGEDS